jgi:8-oxo-dGTP pyrophosphatase MutT (NUDIX family)
MQDKRQTAGQDVKRSPAESFRPAGPDDTPVTQFGALCWRQGEDGVQVLLVTSRDTGRWIIPKGWPILGLRPEETAAREAWEEAGVRGVASSCALGAYTYDKVVDRLANPPVTMPCVVAVYALNVALRDRDFPEADERRHKWMSRKKAARKVDEPELAALIAAFEPDVPGRA